VDALSCPGTSVSAPYTSSDSGKRCSSCTPITTTTCTGSGICAGAGCCPASGSADGQRCSACTGFNTCSTDVTIEVKQTTNPNGNGSCGTYCSCTGPYTNSGTSTCGTTVTEIISYTTPTVFSCVTAADAEKICFAELSGIDRYNIKRCVLGTSAYTYWDCGIRSCGSTYNTNETSTVQRYNTVGSSTVNASYYKVTTGSATITTYYSRIRILSANGYGVSSEAEKNVASSNSSYQRIYGISAATSNNGITAKAYSDTALTTQMSTDLTFTASSPSKIVAGQSGVGIINTPTDRNRQTGNRLDNFTYTNV
jgi:hypothetical protein